MAVYLGNKPVSFNNLITQSSVTITPLTVTANTTYTAPTGYAYSPITVSMGNAIKPSVIRPDAELMKTYSGNYLAVTDKDMVITKPYDTTGRTSLAAGAHLTTAANINSSIPIDLNMYDYLILMRTLTIPTYSITTIGKGRQEYAFSSYIYTYTRLPTNGLKAIINNTIYNSVNDVAPAFGIVRDLYWSSTSGLSMYTSTSYGVHQVVAAPSISSNYMIIKSPSIYIRGSTTYLTTDYYNALSDVQAQYVIDVYRSPKDNLPTDGWGTLDEVTKIINCIKTNNLQLV